jgi:hypothetical protein
MPQELYGELDPASRTRFEAHVTSCDRCSVEFADLQAVLGLVNTRVQAQPPDQFWERVWPDFVANLRESEATFRIRTVPWFRRRWVLNLAGATALVVLGVFIGRFVRLGPATREIASPVPAAINLLAFDDRIDRYLEKSKVVLWSVDNLKAQGASDLDFSPERKMSRSLLRETGDLKESLRASNNDQLLELISQLEVTLLQIANLRETQAPLGVELARIGIQQRALLFQINIEEMRRASERLKKLKQEREGSTRRIG